MKITCIDKETKNVLESGYYRIPRFQRPYSWDRENIEDFWNDSIMESDSDYFIGSMVVFKFPDQKAYGIVDGQQRLTTITIMLCVIRDVFKKEGFEDLAKGTDRLVGRPDIDNKLTYILDTESSFPYFQEYIQKFGKPEYEEDVGEEERNLEAAFTLINDHVTTGIEAIKKNTTLGPEQMASEVKQYLTGLRNKVLKLKLIFIELDDEDDAYIIFETLNTRGKDLTVGDLVKNHLSRLLKPTDAKVDTAKLNWDKIRGTIEGSSADLSIDTFLHHYWLSKHDYVTLKKLFKELRKKVKRENAKDFLTELVEDATTYRQIHETNYRNWRKDEQKIKNALDALQLFRLQQPIPMVLSVMRNYRAGLLKRKEVESILCAIENFHFIFTAVTSQRSSGGVSQMYASSARRLEAATCMTNRRPMLKELRTKLHQRVPSFDQFQVDFRELRYSKDFTKQRKLVRYILGRIDAYYNVAAAIDYNSMTVEHLAPQGKANGQAVAEPEVGRLGNLFLVKSDFNQKLANRSISEKKKLMRRAHLSLGPVLESAKKWTLDEISERTDQMAKVAYSKIWRIK